MNPLNISLLFVICSIMLSFLKNTFFPSASTSQSLKLTKVLQLTDNKIEQSPKKYNSLYEAYHKAQIFDVDKFTNSLPGRAEFNQSILSGGVRDLESSIMCGEHYLVMIVESITKKRGNVDVVNVVTIYKLPLLIKIHQVKIPSKLLLPQTCKKMTNPIPIPSEYHQQAPQGQFNKSQSNYYKFVLIKKSQIVELKIEGQEVLVYRLKRQQDQGSLSHDEENGQSTRSIGVDYLRISTFDFEDGWIAYTLEDRPWVVYLEEYAYITHHYSQQSNQNSNQRTLFLMDRNQIDLLNFQSDTQQPEQQIHHQILIRKLLLKKFAQVNKPGIYISIVYTHHKLGSPNKHILMSCFHVNQYRMKMLSRTSLQNQFNIYETKIDCMGFEDLKKGSFDVSCLLYIDMILFVKFVALADVFGQGWASPYEAEQRGFELGYQGHNQNQYNQKQTQRSQSLQVQEKNQQEHSQFYFDQLFKVNDSQDSKYYDQASSWLFKQFSSFFNQQDSAVDDLQWLTQQTPIATPHIFPQSKSPSDPRSQLPKTQFFIKIPSTRSLRLLKPSLPDPILVYQSKTVVKEQIHLFSFYLPEQIQKQLQIAQQIEVSSIDVKLEPPPIKIIEEEALRNLIWVQKERLVVAVWGGGIQVYQFQSVASDEADAQGIAMAVVIPFIELFATVFCLLRMIWNTQ